MTSSIQSGHYNITQTHLFCFASLVTFLSVSPKKHQNVQESNKAPKPDELKIDHTQKFYIYDMHG